MCVGGGGGGGRGEGGLLRYVVDLHSAVTNSLQRINWHSITFRPCAAVDFSPNHF